MRVFVYYLRINFMIMLGFLRYLFGVRTAADIGMQVPSNLKFGVLVAIALFWADFLRVGFSELFLYYMGEEAPLMVNFLMAVLVTFLGIMVLEGYKRIKRWLAQLQID